MKMTVTKMRKILEILEKHGFGEYEPCTCDGGETVDIGIPSVTKKIRGENIIYLDGFYGERHSEELEVVFKEMEETL